MSNENVKRNNQDQPAMPNSNFGVGLLLLVLAIIGITMMWPKTGDNTGYPDNQRMVGGAQ